MPNLKPQKTHPDATANFRLPVPTLRKLDSYCAATDITRSQLLRRLIANYEPLQQMTDEQQPENTPLPLKYPGWLIKNQH